MTVVKNAMPVIPRETDKLEACISFRIVVSQCACAVDHRTWCAICMHSNSNKMEDIHLSDLTEFFCVFPDN